MKRRDARALDHKTLEEIRTRSGTVVDALGERSSRLVDRDIYAAGPPVMLRALIRDLDRSGVTKARVHFDFFTG